MNEKENWLETLRPDGRPERLCIQYCPTRLITSDPIYAGDFGPRRRGTDCEDWFGVSIRWPQDQCGAMPGPPVCPDVTRWRDYIHFPDPAAVTQGWEAALAEIAAVDRTEEVALCFMGTGIFERLHFLLGFEGALTALLEEPEATLELVEAIGAYRLQYARQLTEILHPDAILSHDDWGAKQSLFFSPAIFRTFFKPQYAKIYGYLKERGVIILHHADSYLEPLVDDMLDLGIDIWQGALPENDLCAIQRRVGGRMTLMGGIDAAAVDRADATEAEIRAAVRSACERYAPGGHFIPCLTYGRAGSVFPHVAPLIDGEIRRFNRTRSA